MMPDESDSENYDETCEESPPECESIIFEAGSPIDRSECKKSCLNKIKFLISQRWIS